MNRRYPEFKNVKKTAAVLLCTVVLCFAGCGIYRHTQWKQLYDTGVQYAQQQKYDKAINYLFAAVNRAPKKNKTYAALEETVNGCQRYMGIQALKITAETSAVLGNMYSQLYTSPWYLPFGDEEALKDKISKSETVENDTSKVVYDYDTRGNIVRKSYYSGMDFTGCMLYVFDDDNNIVITAECDENKQAENIWADIYRADGTRSHSVRADGAGNIKSFAVYNADGIKTAGIGYNDGGRVGVLSLYEDEGNASGISASFDANGEIIHFDYAYMGDGHKRNVTVSYDAKAYSDAVTGEVTDGNRIEVVFYSRYDRVADYHRIFPDNRTYLPQISLYDEEPVWTIEQLLEN